MRVLALVVTLVVGVGAFAQDSKPRLVKRSRAVCTESAKQAGLKVTAHLDIAVDEKGVGTLKDVRPVLTHGMDEAVKQAVSEWRWQVAANNAEAAPTDVKLELTLHCAP